MIKIGWSCFVRMIAVGWHGRTILSGRFFADATADGYPDLTLPRPTLMFA